MAEPKTKQTKASVAAFLNRIADPEKRRDAVAVCRLMRQITGAKPAMWGANIVGFGTYHYTYASGREGDWPLTGFSPRKQNLTIYIMSGFEGEPELMAKLGKVKTGKSCLYFNRLADLHLPTLKTLIRRSVGEMARHSGGTV